MPTKVEVQENGQTVTKEEYPIIPPFAFSDQDSTLVTNQTFKGKVYVADFIFLSCPTICPKMTVELKKVYDAYKGNKDVLFLSHSIDPMHDTIPRLKLYCENLGIDALQWHFVTGAEADIQAIAIEGYFSIAHPDSKAPGGFIHSGGLLLVDRQGHVRGEYDGTNPKATPGLIDDIAKLLEEK